MQSSGDAGVVVVSFGSMVTNMTSERADVIAAALGRIPQKVRGCVQILHKYYTLKVLGYSKSTQ